MLQQVPAQFCHGIQRSFVPWFNISPFPLLQKFFFLEMEQGVHRGYSKCDAVDGESTRIVEKVNALSKIQ